MRRAEVAIVGAAESETGFVPHMTTLELMAQASRRAMSDAGVGPRDVDAVFTATAQVPLSSLALSENLGVTPRYLDSTTHGGSSSLSHIRHAIAAITADMADVALIVYGSTQRSELKRTGSRPAVAFPPALEAPYRPRFPVTSYALMAQRHMAEHGTTREELAEVAVAASEWAALNPAAFNRTRITADDVLASPLVSSPLRVKDCCLITDAGGALVVTGVERAKTLPGRPVHVLGTGEVAEHEGMIRMPDLTVTGAARSGAAAFAEAGLGPEDLDVVEIYDAFTINPIMVAEDLGFCAKGEGGRLFTSGRTRPGGDLPLNTSGGGLAYTHPGMFGMFAVLEAVHQLRGDAGDRQVHGARRALSHGIGGTMSTHCTVLLGV